MRRKASSLVPFRAALAACLLLSLLAAPAAFGQDVDPPVIAVTESGSPLADGSLWNRAVTPVVEVTDASPPVVVDLALDGAPFTSGSTVSGEGTHQLVVTATDDASNVATLTLDFEIDTVAPVFVSVSPEDGALTAAAEVTITGEVAGADAVTVDGVAASLAGGSFSAGPFALGEGERTFSVVASDAAGNSATRAHRAVRDSTPPTVSLSQPAAGAVVGASPVDVVGSVADPHLASVTVNGTVAAVTGGTFVARNVPLAEGSTPLVASATDAAGNSAQASRSVTLDTQAPALAVTDPAAGTVTPVATLTVTGTANDPHLDRVEVAGVTATLTAGTGGAWTWSAAVPLTEGSNALTATAWDVLGHQATANVSVERDSTAPAISIVTPGDGAWLPTETVDVAGTVVEEPDLVVTVNGAAATLTAGAGGLDNWDADDVPLAEGENRLIARVTDGLGNQGAHTRVVYRDTVAPELVAADPADGALAVPPGAAFALTFGEPMAEPSAGDWRLELADGTPVAATATLAGDTLTVRPDADLASEAELRLVLTAALTDLAGNALDAPPTLVYTVADVEAPPAPSLAATPPAYLCASSLTLAGSAEAEGMVEATGGAAAASVRAAADGSFSLTVLLRPAALNHVEVTARDVDGNRSPATVVEVVADCVGPSVVETGMVGETFTVAFDEAVDAASLGIAGAIAVSDVSGPVAGTVAATAADAAVFTPDAALSGGPFRFVVSAAVTDLAGNPLAFPYSEVFGAGVETSFLAGRVIDAATGRPLGGAQVVVATLDGVPTSDPKPEQTTTDDGRFRIPVPPGTHSLVVGRDGYTPVYRVVTSTAGYGADVFDPRLTPAAEAVTIGAAGGDFGSPAAPSLGPALEIPAAALAADAEVAVTALDEQALPALLPYGWSPRGAAWVDLGGAVLSGAATLSFPVDAADGTSLVVASLDPATLQWTARAEVTVFDGAVTATVGDTLPGEGAWAAVEPDLAPTAPPAASVGAVLGSATAPVGDEATAASIVFDPAQVLPAQSSLATVTYTLAADAASGLAVTVTVRETLTLLDGTVRTGAPYDVDAVVYRAADGTPRSRFRLRPSAEASRLPIELGAEDVSVRLYVGETVRGNVLGPLGGTVTNPEGDVVVVPAGGLPEPTAVLLARLAQGDLGTAVPTGFDFLGLVDLDLSGRALSAPAALTLELGAAPGAGEAGLLFQVIDLGGSSFNPSSGPQLRPVAELAATASGWTTAAIDPQDLPWPGVREAGRYLFARSTSDLAFLRGTVFAVGGGEAAGAWIAGAVDATPIEWIQVAGTAAGWEGTYVLPAPLGAAVATAQEPSTGDAGVGSVTLASADERVDLDLFLALTGPTVVETTPVDGAVDVPPGIEPTVRFSETVDPATLATGVLLYEGAELVPVDLELSGTLLRVVPRATLKPATVYELRLTTALKDPVGNRLPAQVTVGFTTLDTSANELLDPTRIHLIEPDATGMAQVLARSGAVPGNALVFVENLSRLISTPSITSQADGSFTVAVEAQLDDVLLLHVLVTGQNEVVFELTPFLAAGGLGAHVGRQGGTFTTLEDLTVTVEPGTFLFDTVVTAEMRPAVSPAPVPSDFNVVAAFELDFGGAVAQKALGIELPKPAGVVETAENNGELLLAKIWRLFGSDYWMLHDFLRIDGELLTTALPPEEQAALRLNAPYAEAVEQLASALPYGGPLASPQEPGGGLAPMTAPSRLGDRKEYLPGSANPGLYVVMENTTLLDFVAFPFVAGSYAYFHQTAIDGQVSVVNGHIERLLAFDAVLMTTRRGQEYRVEGRHLDTGLRFFEATFDPPPAPGEIEILLPDLYGDTEPALPIAGSPLRFFSLLPIQATNREIDHGLSYEFDLGPVGGSPVLTVTGLAGAAAPLAQVRLLGIDDAVDETMNADASGAFTLAAAATVGNRYVLALGAVLGVQDDIEITFSEGLHSALGGIHVDKLKAGETVVQSPDLQPVGTSQTVRISPVPGWTAGATYRLRLTKAIQDGVGNSWDRDLDLEFRIAGSRELDTYALDTVRDVARLGSWLFVAADTDGLLVLDGSDPSDLKSVVVRADDQQPVGFPFPLGDPVTSVAVDRHGRVLVAGGGINGFGQLKIFDPLALDPVAVGANPDDAATRYGAFRGSTIVSDGTSPSTSLPEGRPRHVAVLASDDSDAWRIGLDDPPSGVTLDPESPPASGEWTVTLTGSDGTPGHPVSLHDTSRGRFQRVDAAADGGWSITLDVLPGDDVELLRNRQTLAYLATLGVGIEVVDVDAFYGETEGWIDSTTDSDVVGIYTGIGDSDLRLCQQAVSDVGSSLVDLGTLVGDPAHPLVLVGLVAFKGLAFFESPLSDVGDIEFLGETCIQLGGGAAQVFGLEVVEDYPFDFDGDGFMEDDEHRDYVIVAHRNQGVLIFDVTDRSGVTLAGHVRVPGTAERVSLDRPNRRLFVSAAGEGIYVVDFDRVPSTVAPVVDERVLEVISLPGNTNSKIFVFPELGLAYAGGIGRGLTSIGVGEPRLRAVAEGADGTRRGVSGLAPLGVPSAPESTAENAPDLPASFRLLAELPGVTGQSVRLDVVSLGPGGLPIDPAGDPAQAPGLPPVALTGGDGVLFTRMADAPWEPGYERFISEEVVALADLRAADGFNRTAEEDDACTRCDGGEAGVGEDAREILSGESIGVRFPAALRSSLAGIYDDRILDLAELDLPSVRWETAPSVDQEPALNASLGSGDVAPGTLLHSGEYSHAAVDLTVAGVGLDFAFSRHYRNQTVGNGPLGPGWDHGYRVRLRELPNGDVEYYDGTGRRETFVLAEGGGDDEGPKYEAPTGRFVELTRNRTGWMLLGTHGGRVRFDTFGRLVSVSDPVKQSADTGNEMRFRYDLSNRLVEIEDSLGRSYQLDYAAAGRLTELRDFDGRRVAYAYDATGRLRTVTSPKVTIGETTFPNGLDTVYAYETPAGDLDDRLTTADNLVSITDPKNQTWLQLAWDDVLYTGRDEQLVGQTWGDDTLSIAYSPGSEQTVVTDRRGKDWTYDHDADGHPKKVTDPTGAISQFEYDGEGLLTKATAPLGRETEYAYEAASTERRARGNLRSVIERPDSRGTNGAGSEPWTTAIEYHESNLPSKITDPQGAVTLIQRHESGLPSAIRQAFGTSLANLTSYEYDDRGRVEQVTNPNGNLTSYRYHATGDARGYLDRVTVDPGGLALVTRYEQDARGNVTATVDPRGVRHTMSYNEVDWVVEAAAAVSPSNDGAPALNYVHQWLHDANGNVVEERKPIHDGDQHAVTTFTYGKLDELKTTSHTASPPTQVVADVRAYDENLNLEWYTGPDGTQTHHVYDDRNLLVNRRLGFGTGVEVLEGFGYDVEGQLTSFTDGNGKVWSREYDGFGRLARTIDPLSNKTEILYSESVVSPLAFRIETRHRNAADLQLARSKVEIDVLGRTVSETRDLWEGSAAGASAPVTTSFEYFPAGNLKLVEDPLDRSTQFVYDSAERLSLRSDAAGNTMSWVRNRTGLPITQQSYETGAGDAVIVTTTFEYDALGRRTATIDALDNRHAAFYDARGNATALVDPEGHVTSRRFDSLDRLVEEIQPEGIAVRRLYDPASRLTDYEDALGNLTHYDYDALGRVETVTLPDATTWTRTYDGVGNVDTWTDPNGTFVDQHFDFAGRLTGRTVTPGPGVVGPTTESYAYDGLSRLTSATSGTVAATRVYDSLSRQRSETSSLGSRTLTWTPDVAGRVLEEVLPSGHRLGREFDSIDHLTQVGALSGSPGSETLVPAASYDHRGQWTRVEKQAGALSATSTFDAVRRPLAESASTPLGVEVFGEQLRWTPRSLKSAQSRSDANGAGHRFAYDGAMRLRSQASHADAAEGLIDNTALTVESLDALPHYGFEIDAAHNLLQRTFESESRVEGVTTPVDGSGRNRPSSVNGTLLAYDANGNLIQKGDVTYAYDFRNRLTQVGDAGGVVAAYTYDAFGRRVEKQVGGTVEQTVWSGWRPVELYRGGQLAERRVHGTGLDEVVALEQDTDGDGVLDTTRVPWYDSTGNLVVLTRPDGSVLERYDYTPFGENEIRVDLNPPEIERLVAGPTRLELLLSEEVSLDEVEKALDSGDLEVTEDATGDPVTIDLEGFDAGLGLFSVAGASTTGSGATGTTAVTAAETVSAASRGNPLRRLLPFTVTNPPAAGTAVTLTVASSALQDDFLNPLSAPYSVSFTWPSAETVVDDIVPPVVEGVHLVEGHLEVTFSEDPDSATVAPALDVGDPSVTWTASPDGYTYRSDQSFAPGSHSLTVDTSLLDRAGLPLPADFDLAFEVTAGDLKLVLHERPDPTLVSQSTVGNRLGFHGLELDPETGLYYARHRYYDPELGRFLSSDPLGYVDGPNSYQYALNNPVNFSDPMGLQHDTQYPLWQAQSVTQENTSTAMPPYFEPGILMQGYLGYYGCATNAEHSALDRTGCWLGVGLYALPALGEELGRGVLNTPHDFVADARESIRCRRVLGQGLRASDDPLFYLEHMDAQGCPTVMGGPAMAPPGPWRSVGRSATRRTVYFDSRPNVRRWRNRSSGDFAQGPHGVVGIPGATRLTPAEQVTAARLQREFSLTLRESPHRGAEYLDEFGRSYDAMGTFAASLYWDERQFVISIQRHIRKANDFTVIDLADFTEGQAQVVKAYIDSLPTDVQNRIIRVGF